MSKIIVGVVIPAYNEEQEIADLIHKLPVALFTGDDSCRMRSWPFFRSCSCIW